jgi:hypothetical protein
MPNLENFEKKDKTSKYLKIQVKYNSTNQQVTKLLISGSKNN